MGRNSPAIRTTDNELRVFASLADAKTLLDWRGGGGAAYGIFTWLSERGGGW
jgi:hypothetical protein